MGAFCLGTHPVFVAEGVCMAPEPKINSKGAFSAQTSQVDNFLRGGGAFPEQVARDVYRICVPLPNNPLRALNSYVILEGARPLVIDLGFNKQECYDVLVSGLAALGLAWDDVDVFFTHGHPDHCGMVNMVRRPSTTFYAGFASFYEPQEVHHVDNRGFRAWLQGGYEFLPQGYSRPQVTSEEKLQIAQQSIDYSSMEEVVIPSSDVTPHVLHDGDVFVRGSRRFEVIETKGHSEGHLCLYDPDDKLLFCGDQMLAKITPVVSTFALGAPVLKEFIASTKALGQLGARLALGGHRDPILDVACRAEELVEHHEKRNDEIVHALEGGALGLIEITKSITWRSPIPNWDDWPLKQKFFSMGETLAHLSYLESEGQIGYRIEGRGVLFSAF